MKLFLASSIDKTLSLLEPSFKKRPSETRVVFVANAADPYAEKWWVDLDRNKFRELGYQVHEINLKEISAADFSKALAETDILHMCGGSVFYLINLIKEKKLDAIIIDTVKNDRIIYTGTSAGSIVVSSSIAAFSYDEEEKADIEKVPDKRGLGLIDFAIVPHCNQTENANEHKKIVDHMTENPEPLIFLQDNQAVLVEDDHFKILST